MNPQVSKYWDTVPASRRRDLAKQLLAHSSITRPVPTQALARRQEVVSSIPTASGAASAPTWTAIMTF